MFNIIYWFIVYLDTYFSIDDPIGFHPYVCLGMLLAIIVI